MLSTIPMSVAFICAAEEARVSRAAALRQRHFVPDDGGQVPVRLTPPISWTIWLAQLADGRALVQADTRIDVGYEVSLPSPGTAGSRVAPKIVASIDRTARAATREWLITWEGKQASVSAPADAPLVQAQLAPEWFAQPLLRWIHETARTRDQAIDLAGFAEHDVPLDSVVTLAGHLAADGLIIIGSSGQTATATLTADGITATEQAAAARADPRQRSQALRRGMITWLADRENASDTPHDWTRFLHDPRATFCGDFFTIHELAREAQYLAEHELIRGLAARDSADFGWTRPRLTAKGRDCNDNYGGDVAEALKPEQPGKPVHISVTGSPGTQIKRRRP